MKSLSPNPAWPAQTQHAHAHVHTASALAPGARPLSPWLAAAACALLFAAPLTLFSTEANAQYSVNIGAGGDGGGRGSGAGGPGRGQGEGSRGGIGGGGNIGRGGDFGRPPGQNARPPQPPRGDFSPGYRGGDRGGYRPAPGSAGGGGDFGRPPGQNVRPPPPRSDFSPGYRGDDRGGNRGNRDGYRPGPGSAHWGGPPRYAPPPRYVPPYRYAPPRYAAPWPAWRPGWRWDGYYGHNHYYPPYGYSVSFLSPGFLSFAYGGGRFFFSGGIWYRPSGSSYVVVAPPIGIGVPVLPPYATPVAIGSVSYYYANGAYYAPAAGTSGYVVVDPPVDRSKVEVTPEPAPPPAAEVIAYPREQQGHEQIERDRSECEDWAADQVNKMNGHSVDGDYQRALSACLEGRGYTVR